VLAAALLAAAMFSQTVWSSEVARVLVTGAWLRWLPNDLPAAGYLTVRNEGKSLERLTNVTSSDYSSVMLHRSVSENGVDRMIMVSGIDIAPGASISLAPGGYHLMLTKPNRPINPGDTVRLHLVFAHGAGIDIVAPVRPPVAPGQL
jgi:hypothetical protein